MKSDIIKVINKNNFSTSVGIRLGFYVIGYEIIKDHPIIGVGISDVMTSVKKYSEILPYNFKRLVTMPNVHNDFLQIFISLGIIGIIVYVLIFYNILKIKINNIRYKNLPIIFISVFFISSMFENMFHQQFSMLLFTLFIGLFLAINRLENEEYSSINQ